MNDPKQKLTAEGFTRQEVDLILEKAVELQRQAEERGYLERDELEEGAEAAGIQPDFIEEAIKKMREQLREEKAANLKKRRLYRIVALSATAAVVILFIWGHSLLNSRLSTVEKTRAQLENVLQRRHDLIPNLVSVARRTATHEQELVESINQYQAEIGNTSDFELKQAWEQKLGGAINELMKSLSENPAGASAAMFTRLSDEMAGAENRISFERKRYNEAAADYNRTARGFLVSFVRPFMGFPGSIALFEASQDAHDTPKY